MRVTHRTFETFEKKDINYIENSLQLKGNFLTSQGIALGVEITTSKGGKLQPP